jgi:hypothetical protein
LKKALFAFWLVVVVMVFSWESRAALLCGPYKVIRALIERQQETLAYRGVDYTGANMVELFLSSKPKQGFSVLIRAAQGQTCLLVSGYYWHPVGDQSDGT